MMHILNYAPQFVRCTISLLDMYIEPTVHIHATLAEAKDFSNSYESYYPLSDKSRVRIPEIVQGKRNLIIGEPGAGKTLLLSKIEGFLKSEGISSCSIPLKDRDSFNRIDQCLSTRDGSSGFALLLDGLDEIQGSLFPSILEKIEHISKVEPNIAIYLSSRSVFANRHANSFADYRVFTLSPLTRDQVANYLIAAGHRELEVDAFLNRIMSFSHGILVVQIPRYLVLLSEFLANKQIDSVRELSRNEIFEYFIYKKLNLEDERLNVGKWAITKRLLEKLALTMEIYQANAISKDELITFLDELQSDLKLAALTQWDLQMLFDKSLLKDNIDAIEFDNTEFQEYLAAKEITRFPDPRLAAFTFAVEPNIGEIHPTWFNTLTFLVDMQPDLIEQLIEFSGIRAGKAIDEGFINFLSRIDPNRMKGGLKTTLFQDLFAYYNHVLQWIPVTLASSLSDLYDPSLETLLKSEVANSEGETDHKRYIPLGNVAMIVGHLLDAGAQLDRGYWRTKLLGFAGDDNENGVLQRYGLFALGKLKDPTVVSEVPSRLIDGDELIVRALLTLCTEVAPDSPISVHYFVEATRQGEIHGRYGLYALKDHNSLKTFLRTLYTDDVFLRTFLDKSAVFKGNDRVIVEHMEAVCDEEITELSKNVLVRSFRSDFAHDAERSAFILGLGELLKRKIPDFFPALIEEVRKSHIPSRFFFTRAFFAALVQLEDVSEYLRAMIIAGEQMAAFGVMQTIKFSGTAGAEEIFRAGRAMLPDLYDAWERESAEPGAQKTSHRDRILGHFEKYLEPEPSQYNVGVFAFYLEHVKDLDPVISPGDRSRLALLITGSVLKNIDPANYDLTATDKQSGSVTSYTVSANIGLFGNALRVAEHLSVDVSQFRQRVVNYIPFAYGDHLQAIFKLIPDITSSEMMPVIEIYKQHKSDLWRHMPSNLIDVVERYHIVDALPILKAFVKESTFAALVRQRALVVADSFGVDKGFLEEVATAYENSSDPNEAAIAGTAVDLLITNHFDPSAIRQKLGTIIERATPFTPIASGHFVGPIEEEIIGGKTFAAPLMKLKIRGFEQDYLHLLDSAALLWAKGKHFYAYSTYLWDIVYAYFDNLKEHGSYEPLQALEKKLSTIRDKHGSNWLLARMVQLRRSYLAYLGKPQNIAEAISQYNRVRHQDNKKILNSEDLHNQLKDVIDTDLSRWIQAEGAYDLLLTGKVFKTKHQQYEKLVQKTLKNEIENILLRRGFQIEVLREPQLLDDKRTDLLVRYGFAGPIVIEVKLSSNSDMKMSKPELSPSFLSMKQYMQGFGASHGIFLIVYNGGAQNLQRIQSAFTKIPNVWVKIFDYRKEKPVLRETKKAFRERRVDRL